MKFEVDFTGTCSYQSVRGLTLLDLARQIAPTLKAGDCVDAQVPDNSVVVEIGEDLARECGHFENDNKFWVRVSATNETWRGLFRAVSVEMADGRIRPAIKADGAPLLAAWREAGFPKELTYPPAADEADV